MPREELRLDKHSAYFNLVESFSSGCCPICILKKNWSDKFIQTMLYESVNDKFFRSRLAKTAGFCNIHSWRIASFNNAMSTAILFKDRLDKIIASLSDTKITIQKNLKPCLLCDTEETAESHYINVMASSISEESFWEKFEQSAGLCYNHLVFLLKIVAKSQKKRIIDFQKKRFSELSENLSLFIDKFDYRNRNAVITEDEKKLWKDAISVTSKINGVV